MTYTSFLNLALTGGVLLVPAFAQRLNSSGTRVPPSILPAYWNERLLARPFKTQSLSKVPHFSGGGGGGGGSGPGSGTALAGQDISTTLSFRSFQLPDNVAIFTTGAINARGDIVGSYCLDSACITSHGYRLHGSTTIPFDFPGAPLTSAEGINDSGRIVGWYWDPSFITTHGAVFPGSSFDLCGFGHQTRFLGINNLGHIAGTCGPSDSFLLTDAGLTTIPAAAFPDAVEAFVTNLNSTDQYVGYTFNGDGTTHGIIGDLITTPVQLDFPGAGSTQLLGINDSGQILGQAFDSAGDHGFVCTKPGTSTCFKYFDVLSKGARATNTQPTGINSIGEIVGKYTDMDGNHGFVAAPFTTSYYVHSTNSLTLFAMGADFAVKQLASTFDTQDSIVALLFRAPTLKNGEYGVAGLGGATPLSTIATLVEDFVSGYYNALGSNDKAHARIIIATSNSTTQCGGDQVTYGHGQAWAQMVGMVASWIISQGYGAQVDVAGGSDMEISDDRWPSHSACNAAGSYVWSSSEHTRAWVDGYSSIFPQRFLYDLGDAGGCPQSGTTAIPGNCNRQWTQEDAWYVAWGAEPSLSIPEIYSANGSQAREWTNLSLYGYLAHGLPMNIAAVLTQFQSCEPNCGTLGNTPSDAWQQLYDSLNADERTAQNLVQLTDIENGSK